MDSQRLPFDDERISADDRLIRYVNPDAHLAPDHGGNLRIASNLFSPSSKKIDPLRGWSAEGEWLILAAGLEVQARLPRNDFGAIAVRAGALRSLALLVACDPIPGNDFHCSVWGIGDRQKRALANPTMFEILFLARGM